MASQDLRRPTPLGSRVIERRTRSRTLNGAAQVVPWALMQLGVGAAAAAGLWLGREVIASVRRLQLASKPVLRAVSAGSDPVPVRLRGVVEALGPGFVTPGSRDPVVFARTVFMNRRQADKSGQARTLSDELRGVDFCVRLPSGDRVKLAALDVRLMEPPIRVPAPNLDELARRGGERGGGPALVRETRVCEGDTVEALGVLVKEVNPGGAGAFARGTPLLHRLVPAPGARVLWVRAA